MMDHGATSHPRLIRGEQNVDINLEITSVHLESHESQAVANKLSISRIKLPSDVSNILIMCIRTLTSGQFVQKAN